MKNFQWKNQGVIKVEENGTIRTVKIGIKSITKRYVEEMQKLFSPNWRPKPRPKFSS